MQFRTIGTPLPPEASDKERFVPVWKQEARDEQGRRRFHGAFTGGFVAGYHNTVGSREGWTPAAFTSSRDRRAGTQKGRQVEDYMDEEDLRGLRGEDTLAVSDAFSSTGALVAKRGLGWEILRSTGWQGDDQTDASLAALLELARRAMRSGTDARRSGGIGGVLEEEEEEGEEDEDESLVYSNRQLKSVKYDRSIELERDAENRQPSIRGRDGGLDVERSHLECLKGFVPALRQCLAEINVSPLVIPEGFRPKGPYVNRPVHAVGKGNDGQREALSVEQRASMLGEKATVERSPTGKIGDKGDVRLDVATAMCAQRGYMPFQALPLKDARYRQFLAHFVAPHAVPLPERLPNMSVAEFRREQEEFFKSAIIYRPLPSAMAAKFVSASTSKSILEASVPSRSGLYRPEAAPEAKREAPPPDVLPSGRTGARRPYGELTRSESVWIPSASLCKLFGVDPPASPAVMASAAKKVAPVLALQSVKEIVTQSLYSEKVDMSAFEPAGISQREEEEDAAADIAEDPERPAMELFKSIFCASSSSSDGESEEVMQPSTLAEAPTIFPSADGPPSPQALNTTRRRPRKQRIQKLPAVQVIDEPVEAIVRAAKPKIVSTAASMMFADEEEADEEAILVKCKKTRPAASDLW